MFEDNVHPRNIYEIYQSNGNTAGFWVQRTTWLPRTVAKILSIDAKGYGHLSGIPPCFNNPVVLCEFYENGNLQKLSMVLPNSSASDYIQIEQPDFTIGQEAE
ncbi:hypothetical protein A1359_15770 [Methylomonas lenta]|uniref:Uncharacterized protein n=1 Tax=Methylomonas lenta TaxID=980561 RepID=A0A177N0P4_9GAMM|nr:hypothetical protein [Methylomonas lenta]OAI10719.1 hypothetical protein A1359_15770 [Methylomonas lenta]